MRSTVLEQFSRVIAWREILLLPPGPALGFISKTPRLGIINAPEVCSPSALPSVGEPWERVGRYKTYRGETVGQATFGQILGRTVRHRCDFNGSPGDSRQQRASSCPMGNRLSGKGWQVSPAHNLLPRSKREVRCVCVRVCVFCPLSKQRTIPAGASGGAPG